MIIGRNVIGKVNSNKDNEKNEIVYESPEILMIDCDENECKKLKEKGFNIAIGTFGKKYKIEDQYGNKKVTLNSKIDNIIEKDIVIIDMKQRNTNEIYRLEDLEELEDGTYITTHKKQKEFNPINVSSKFHTEDFGKLINKDSVIIIFSDRKIEEKYDITTCKKGYYSNQYETISNYDFLPFDINPSECHFETEKYNIIVEGIFKDIFKHYKGKIHSRATFCIDQYQDKNTVRLLENIYGDLIGYFQFFENNNKTRNTLIVLPQCENMSLIIENILTEVLPFFYPEIFKDFVKDTWMDKEEYMLPEIKNIIKEKENIEKEYKIKLDKINERIKVKQEETKYLYNVISSTGTGDKLVENIIKCLEYLEYTKVDDWDKVRGDDEKEEDIHIYKNEKEYFIAEVKGINGPAIEDDCNVIVKYKSRNCSKLKVSSMHGVVFVNYHKNVEPNKREEFGFTSKEIKDAIRDEYTLVGTYELFKAIRLCQENIISKESIRKSLETPGIFKAIPTNYELAGKMENVLNKINVLSMQVESNDVDQVTKGENVGIKIDKNVPKLGGTQVYLINNKEDN